MEIERAKKKIVFIDGGLGRVICSIPAVERLAENNDVIVIASHVEPYMYNDKIERVYHVSHPYLFEDIIQENEFIHPEPYTFYGYYNEKMHLIQAFEEEINGIKMNKEIIEKPNIYLAEDEEKFGKDFIDGIKKHFKKDKVIIFQPFGQGATPINCADATCGIEEVKDPSNRSLSKTLATQIAKELSKDAIVVYYGQIMIDCKDWVIPQPMPNPRGWFAITKYADAILAVDSSLQHIAYSMEKKGIVLMGGTYKSNVSYPEYFTVYQRDGFPKMYDPIRIPAMNLTTSAAKKNAGAMLYSEREVQQIINNMKELI